jgi:hypothetical protein
MEFQNYERELKYLLTGNSKLSLEQIFRFLNRYGYELLETCIKKKHEAYYDDKELKLLNRGDVMRSSKYISENISSFMYKKNVSDPSKPYVSKYEFGSGQYKTIEDFIAEHNLDVKVQANPILYAKMIRDTCVVEKGGYRLLITYDKVCYFRNKDSASAYEEMLEIEDWTRPNTVDGDRSYDAHLCDINKVLLDGELPIKLTKQTKPYRGYKILNEST